MKMDKTAPWHRRMIASAQSDFSPPLVVLVGDKGPRSESVGRWSVCHFCSAAYGVVAGIRFDSDEGLILKRRTSESETRLKKKGGLPGKETLKSR